MLKGKTKSGFKYEIADERLNNYELLESMAEVDSNPLMLPMVINLLLGKENAAALKSHVRGDGEFIPTEKLSQEIQEIFNGQEIKNS
jgi:hypothetical protein